MKTKLPWILLIASAVFNVSFAVGFLAADGDSGTKLSTRERAMALAKKMDLSESQMPAFLTLVDRYEQLRQSRTPQREAFMNELVRPEPDQKILEDYVVGPDARQYRLDRLALMREFMDLLTNEQRTRFADLVSGASSSPK
jgi:hypothetical protein